MATMIPRSFLRGCRSRATLPSQGVPLCRLPSAALGRAFAAPTQTADVPRIPKSPAPVGHRPKPKELRDLKLGFLGWGAMAQAVSLGVVRKGLTEADSVACCDVVPEVLVSAKAEGLKTMASGAEVVDWADIVVVAVKPQVVNLVLREIAPHWTSNKILVSICAGVTIGEYEHGLRCAEGAKIIRVMPNTPCLVAEAATAYAGSNHCLEWELDLVHGIFSAVGRATHKVPEYLLNAVTGLSGSGPAYVYMLIQAMSDAGVHGGLPRNVSLSLATQTVIGAAKMVQQTETHPAVLKEAVTSPAGTTIAGVRVLERMNFSSAVIEAVEAARMRSEELSDTPDFLFEKKGKTSSLHSV